MIHAYVGGARVLAFIVGRTSKIGFITNVESLGALSSVLTVYIAYWWRPRARKAFHPLQQQEHDGAHRDRCGAGRLRSGMPAREGAEVYGSIVSR